MSLYVLTLQISWKRRSCGILHNFGPDCGASPCYADAASLPTSRQHPVQCNVYQYRELQAATADFSERNIIGEGGFGRVYKGRLPNGTIVAVKRLDRHGLQVYLHNLTRTSMARHIELCILSWLDFCVCC